MAAATTNEGTGPARAGAASSDRVLRTLLRPRTYRSLISLAVFLIGWQLIGEYVLTNKLFFVPLSDVAVAFVRLTLSGELWTNIVASFKAISYGMALAIVICLAFAGVSLTWALQWLEKRIIRWRPMDLED